MSMLILVFVVVSVRVSCALLVHRLDVLMWADTPWLDNLHEEILADWPLITLDAFGAPHTEIAHDDPYSRTGPLDSCHTWPSRG